MKIFIDTWGWLALGDKRDKYHHQVQDLYRYYRDSKARIITSDYVLDEAITLVFLRTPFHEAVPFIDELLMACKQKYIALETISWGRFLRAWELRQKFRDKPRVSFTDLTSFAVMQELKISQVLTGDIHFEQAGMDFKILPKT